MPGDGAHGEKDAAEENDNDGGDTDSEGGDEAEDEDGHDDGDDMRKMERMRRMSRMRKMERMNRMDMTMKRRMTTTTMMMMMMMMMMGMIVMRKMEMNMPTLSMRDIMARGPIDHGINDGGRDGLDDDERLSHCSSPSHLRECILLTAEVSATWWKAGSCSLQGPCPS